MDTSKMTTAELVEHAKELMRHRLTYIAEVAGAGAITMTDAAEAMYGSGGRGSRVAVRQIETMASEEWGYMRIVNIGTRKRLVSVTDKGWALIGKSPVVEG